MTTRTGVAGVAATIVVLSGFAAVPAASAATPTCFGQRATIVGTKMAGLLGGTGEFTLPNTDVPVHFPVERLYHVDGTPREDWKPSVWFDPTDPSGPDTQLAAGLDALKAKMAGN